MEEAIGEICLAQNSQPMIWAIWMRASSLISWGTEPPRWSMSQYRANSTATSGFWPIVRYHCGGGLFVTLERSITSRNSGLAALSSICGTLGTCVIVDMANLRVHSIKGNQKKMQKSSNIPSLRVFAQAFYSSG